MKKKMKTIILIIVILIIAYLYAHVEKNYYLYDRSQDSGEYIPTGVLENETLSQEFTAQDDKIDGMKVMSTVFGVTDNVKVTYELVESSTGNSIVEGKIEGGDFENGKFFKFDFKEKNIRKGAEYCFFLKESGSDSMNGIGFSIGNRAFEYEGELAVKGNSTDGALVARPVCDKFDIETFIMFLVLIAYIAIFMKLLYKLFK